MRRLVGYFIRGLVFLAPVAFTIYVCITAFRTIDGWLGISTPGVGFAITIAIITVFGFLASNLLTRSALSVFEDLLNRLPLVRLLYSSTRDLVGAVVGDKRRFDKAVVVRLHEGGSAYALGFVTQESLGRLGLEDFVSVYFPLSYSVAGRLYFFPASAVRRVDAASADVMAFLISGGVTEVPGAPVIAGRGGNAASS